MHSQNSECKNIVIVVLNAANCTFIVVMHSTMYFKHSNCPVVTLAHLLGFEFKFAAEHFYPQLSNISNKDYRY